MKDYYAYYKTPRGYHARSLNSNGGWNKTSFLSFINAKLLAYAGEIESDVMVLHGEKAHSRYFGETAFKMLKGDNNELVIVPGASHCDLYDGGGKGAIPFDRIEAFYSEVSVSHAEVQRGRERRVMIKICVAKTSAYSASPRLCVKYSNLRNEI